MSLLSGQSWQLDRYARFVCDANKSVKDGKWKESHSLVRAQCWMRGLSRNDSLLFMYKFQSETRKFRVRFSKKDDVSGTEICTKVIHQLSRFFPIKTSTTGNSVDKTDFDGRSKEEHSEVMQPESMISNKEMNSSTQLHGEVTVGVMAQAILNSKPLPLAYHQHHEDLDMIPQLVRMCLGDPTFPAFVESVEAALTAVINGSQ